ncbi:MAG: alpha/beta fold hydrolase [Deltaproteobacteria bacterium]|nr:alpha/beta fold hydrolase [Deltaproteobacteria bacterium]
MRYLYLHGFASGPNSTKGVAFAQHFAEKGIAIERVDLRVPSFEQLRLSAMIEKVRGLLADNTVLIGSSLGGLTAARVAEADPRVHALVLLAPAFQLAQRWQTMLGPAFDEWKRTGWREVTDYTTGKPARVDFGFVEDAARIDRGYPRIHCSTLILHGRGDDTVPIDRSREIVAQQPHIRLVELDDGHELTRSLPALLAETELFLAGV